MHRLACVLLREAPLSIQGTERGTERGTVINTFINTERGTFISAIWREINIYQSHNTPSGCDPIFFIALICTTRRRIQASASADQGSKKDDLILLSRLVESWPDARYTPPRSSVLGFWFLVFGFWFLVSDFWSSVFGFWFLVFSFFFFGLRLLVYLFLGFWFLIFNF